MAAFCGEKIEQRYGRRRILTDCTLYAEVGECVGIAGRNGSGKSTLLMVLSGARRPTGGRLRFGETDLLKKPSAFPKVVGYVPQTNPLIEELSAAENLRLLTGRRIRPEDPVVRELQLEEFYHTRVARLSGGMKRRLSIACAIADRPPVLVMDEPTSALDLHQKAIIFRYLERYRADGGIVIMATHEREEMQACSRLYLIDGGVSEEISPERAIQRMKGEEEHE